ncbi:hypothetical protein [Alphabaculovirus myunipunctae]|uniref:Uncharacterized protein n=1 Tax=Mythimna unipuncta nucleopolyhedrovirus TaxID=447897 RepID=A0A2K9VS66_9ABAC|nr:hypothetical protein [Mythimna unipuncta nucleopolyhedrovirus]AUV65290.1 hypothetical protein [Mythimna unipuncta nucleopolyhedrovirus]
MMTSLSSILAIVKQRGGGEINMFVESLVELRCFIENVVDENATDDDEHGYESREKLVKAIIEEIVDAHLNDPCRRRRRSQGVLVCYRTCQDCDTSVSSFRKITTLKRRYVCRKCGVDLVNDSADDDNNDDITIDKAIELLQMYRTNVAADTDEEDDDDDDTDIDDEDDINVGVDSGSGCKCKKLNISKLTILKFVTELVLLVRCWVWGLCEKPWYILWRRNDKSKSV